MSQTPKKPPVNSTFLRLLAMDERRPAPAPTPPAPPPPPPRKTEVPVERKADNRSTVESHSTVERKARRHAQTKTRAVTAQDGHTVWEQTVYAYLWSKAAGNGEARTISAGYRTLAAQVGLSDKGVMLNLRSLEAKLSIETLMDPGPRQARTYRVYSYRLILDRRRAAGLEWVIRSKQGVYLSTVECHSTVGRHTTVESHSTVECGSTGGVECHSIGGVEWHSTHLGNNREEEGIDDVGTPSTVESHSTVERKAADLPTDLPGVSNAVFDVTGERPDPVFLEKLVILCRAKAPDINPDEIAYFTRAKINRAMHMGTIRNLTGFLLTAVPLAISQASLSECREIAAAAARREEALRRQRAADGRNAERELALMVLRMSPAQRAEIQADDAMLAEQTAIAEAMLSDNEVAEGVKADIRELLGKGTRRLAG